MRIARADVIERVHPDAPGDAFRMGDDRFYPEEAPIHSVTVGGF